MKSYFTRVKGKKIRNGCITLETRVVIHVIKLFQPISIAKHNFRITFFGPHVKNVIDGKIEIRD